MTLEAAVARPAGAGQLLEAVDLPEARAVFEELRYSDPTMEVTA
jgi:hypothetical protein